MKINIASSHAILLRCYESPQMPNVKGDIIKYCTIVLKIIHPFCFESHITSLAVQKFFSSAAKFLLPNVGN